MTEDAVTTQAGPFAQVPVWVLTVGLSGAELAVYVALRSFADRSGGARPKVKTIAERAGVSERTTERAVARMRDLGLLSTVLRRRPDGSIAGCDYHLADLPPARQAATVTPHPDEDVATPPTRMSPGTDEAVGARRNTPKEHTKETESSSSSPPARHGGQRFDEFWQTYPRREGKAAARRAWDKATRDADPDRVIAAAGRYASDPNRDPAYTKHASTWLTAGCWDDEPLPPRVPAQRSTTNERFDQASGLVEWAAAQDAAERLALEQQQPLAIVGTR